MNYIRNRCRQIINKIAERECGMGLDCLPDLPCIAHALDEMVELVEYLGEDAAPMSELQDIAQDAVFELLEEEGFPV